MQQWSTRNLTFQATTFCFDQFLKVLYIITLVCNYCIVYLNLSLIYIIFSFFLKCWRYSTAAHQAKTSSDKLIFFMRWFVLRVQMGWQAVEAPIRLLLWRRSDLGPPWLFWPILSWYLELADTWYPDQTAPSGAVWSGSAQSYMSLCLEYYGWLVGCFGLNGPLRQYFSLYRAVS